MSLFVCDKCGVVENTALSRYWLRDRFGDELLCSQCDPEIGKWHGLLPREQWDGKRIVNNRPSD
jgi:hypothetical protein